MTNLAIVIDFNTIKGPVYVGRERGERLREELFMNRLDTQPNPVVVLIPDSTYTLSTSFFLGMFGPSIQHAGSKEAFFDKYRFTMPGFLKEIIEDHVYNVLHRVTI